MHLGAVSYVCILLWVHSDPWSVSWESIEEIFQLLFLQLPSYISFSLLFFWDTNYMYNIKSLLLLKQRTQILSFLTSSLPLLV